MSFSALARTRHGLGTTQLSVASGALFVAVMLTSCSSGKQATNNSPTTPATGPIPTVLSEGGPSFTVYRCADLIAYPITAAEAQTGCIKAGPPAQAADSQECPNGHVLAHWGEIAWGFVGYRGHLGAMPGTLDEVCDQAPH